MLETKGKSKNEEFLSDESGMSESNNNSKNSFRLTSIIQHREEWVKPIEKDKIKSIKNRSLTYYNQIVSERIMKTTNYFTIK